MKLDALQVLLLEQNKFSEFPVTLLEMKSLKNVSLKKNQIFRLPQELMDCFIKPSTLLKVDLRENRISEEQIASPPWSNWEQIFLFFWIFK